MKISRDSAKKRAARSEPRLSRLHAPSGVATEVWQAALRRQFGREQNFKMENTGSDSVFSEYRVTNAESGGRYRVAIRGSGLGDNFCSCPDFATNELGTCKHVEFALARLEKKRGGRTALKRGYQPPFSEIYMRYGAQRSIHFRPGAECPPLLRTEAQSLFDENAGWRLSTDRFGRLERFLTGVNGHDLRIYDDARDFIAQSRDCDRRNELLDEAYPQGVKSPALRRLLNVPLHPYQIEGALFAARAGRCLIGDDMGLGKTVQAIAAAEMLSRHLGVERVLVVCPTSLKHQWELELAKFSGKTARVIGGNLARRRELYAEPGAWKIAAYDTLKRDLDIINAWSPDLVIVDEAQRIKNWNTIVARALKRVTSPYAFVLTGTPLENRLEELISIVQYVDRYRLGPTWRLLDEHQERDETGRVIGYRRLDAIGQTLAPIMIRRRKAEVLSQLPKRVDKNLFVPMTPQQMQWHEENREMVVRIVAKWRRYRFLSEGDQRRLTCALQNMRMSCDSTWLLDRETDHGVKADELAPLLDDLFEDPAAKAVIFSQWIGMHEMIVRRLEARGLGYVLFNGGVPSEQRGQLVERFRSDPACRIFLSTDAGGVGLNLQHAATVINMDLPWNPAVLEQRIGRVHRLGQQKSVQVVNFIAQGTIEEGMLSVLSFKRSLFAGVLDGGSPDISLNGTRLSRFMEGVEKATQSMGNAEVVADDAPAPAAADASAHDADEAPEPQFDTGTTKPEEPQETSAADPWRGLVDAGLRLVSQLTSPPASGNGSSLLETDPDTGRSYLRLPVPDPAALAKLAEALRALLPVSRGS